jgi:hypothetical protein
MSRSHQLLLLHFGVQCPWQPWVVEQARQAASELGSKLQIVNVSEQPELAARYRLFYPFMIVVDETLRLPSPTPASKLVDIVTQGLDTPPLALLHSSLVAEAETIKPLTVDNFTDVCVLCIPLDNLQACQAKANWARGVASQVPEGFLGFAAYHAGNTVGAVEVLPVKLVPYPLSAKTPDIAFITCLYSQENGMDFRGQLLECLMKRLPEKGYRELYVVAGRRLPYPNGPVDFFVRYGFEPIEELDRIVVSEGEDTLVLLRSVLNKSDLL